MPFQIQHKVIEIGCGFVGADFVHKTVAAEVKAVAMDNAVMHISVEPFHAVGKVKPFEGADAIGIRRLQQSAGLGLKFFCQ